MESHPPIILHVEDSDLDAEKVTRAFVKLGYSCPLLRARDGLEALTVLRAHPAPTEQAHVVLLDLNMPRMNGLEFLDELRADDSIAGVTIYVLTTSGRAADRASAERHGVSGYLVKPKTVPEMVEMLRNLDSLHALCKEGRRAS